MIFRVVVALSQKEFDGLTAISIREIRSPRDQIRFLIRRELIQAGFIDPALGTGSARDITPPQP